MNGKCFTNEDNKAQCFCDAHWTGPNCNIDVDECAVGGHNPCKYGTCVNEEGGYRCECDPGFKGDRCETDIDDCALNPCRNGASCINNVGQGYTCACKSGFRGKKCEFEISKCESNPCLNGGKCLGRFFVENPQKK